MVSRYEEGRYSIMAGVTQNPHEKGTWDRREWERGRADQLEWLRKYAEYKRNSSLFS